MFFKDLNEVIQWYTKETKPMNVEEVQQVELRELVREYVDQMLEEGREPNQLEFEQGLDSLTFEESLHITNLMICEIERWKQLKPGVRESA